MQGTPKAIEIKGIVRNATVIGAQDGQAEDLINLRFMDGSWRASGDGRLINFTMGTEYSQLYVHTNVYHHLLGVHEDTTTHVRTLYWFADIASDEVTFTPLATPVALTTVVGDIWITQTGHLLTIIDEADDFEHFIFKTGDNKYAKTEVDVNGKATDRTLYPFGKVHFNCYCPNHGEEYEEKVPTDTEFQSENDAFGWAIEKMKDKNKFSQPFFAVACFKLYDGSYIYASNPVYIHPREAMNNLWLKAEYLHVDPTYEGESGTIQPGKISRLNHITDALYATELQDYGGLNDSTPLPFAGVIDIEGVYDLYREGVTPLAIEDRKYCPQFIGSDLTIAVDETMVSILRDTDVFQSLCIFVTAQAPTRATSSEWGLNHKNQLMSYDEVWDGKKGRSGSWAHGRNACGFRKHKYVIDELLHSPFYLLKEYTTEQISQLLSNSIVDISAPEYDGLLKNIVQQKTLPIEAAARTTYLPKVSYMYNGRLHIANYKSYPFFGYPIDLFHLHNHSVKVQADSWFKDVLPNLADNNDSYLQYARTNKNINAADDLVEEAAPVFFVKVYIDSSQGEQVVCRYIPAYEISDGQTGRADFIEDLNPLLTYPDVRAKRMTIYYVDTYKSSATTEAGHYWSEGAYVKYKRFNLKPHPYLNLAYYIDPDLKPIKLSTFTPLWEENSYSFTGETIEQLFNRVKMQNTEEYFQNGLKVSKTDNPMFFPVENHYQVGSAEILALMSNTIAVGTGQTGAAPLYVFCKDGVYALFVDTSGQMTYSNSRVLARDVCNNPRSVTPIDAGVVFTTDRGLMMIAGEQVEEIGQPAEGDVLHYTNVNAQGQPLSVEGSKIATDALTKIAGLPSSLCDTTNFLTYLQGAIVNYNHNMRELIVSNPNKGYSYVLDREQNWSRRDYTAAEYVNNYPTSYRVTSDGKFYKLDDEGDANTSLEHRKEADNKIFYLSNVIKLDSIGFKQAYRFVVRGYFEGVPCAKGTINGVDVYIYDKGAQLIKNTNFGNIIRLQYKLSWGVVSWVNADSNFPALIRIINQFTGEDITDTIVSADAEVIYNVTRSTTPIACVVEGSYDGRKFAPLGFNRKSGKFTNIGCHVSHTDMRFYRVILAGQVTGKTRIDYMELSANGSVLNTKIR